jgi:hypothetical protein
MQFTHQTIVGVKIKKEDRIYDAINLEKMRYQEFTLRMRELF